MCVHYMLSKRALYFPGITCVTSSLCFLWLSNEDKILSNTVCRIFLVRRNQNQVQSISPMS